MAIIGPSSSHLKNPMCSLDFTYIGRSLVVSFVFDCGNGAGISWAKVLKANISNHWFDLLLYQKR